VQTKLILYLPKAETFSRALAGEWNHPVGSTDQGTEPQQMERNEVSNFHLIPTTHFFRPWHLLWQTHWNEYNAHICSKERLWNI